MKKVLEGKLVRILDGRLWDLWTEEGHAGLGQVLRQFEGREVRVTIADVPVRVAKADSGTSAEDLEELETQAIAAAVEVQAAEERNRPRRSRKRKRAPTGKQGKAKV